jgi:hypothetical protein
MIVCVRGDGAGDVTDTHLVWQQRRGATDVPSPIYHQGQLYLVNDKGVATCLDGATGEFRWQNRLGGDCSASPVLAGDRLLASDERGRTHLFQVAGQIRPLARNALNDPILSSPALSGSQVFLRSQHFLWCLQPQQEAAAANDPGPSRPRQVESRPRFPSPGQAPQPKAPANQSSFGDDWFDYLLMGLLGVALLMWGVFFWLVLKARRAAALPSPSASAKKPQATVAKPQSKPQPARTIPVSCSGCEKRLRVASALAGKKVRCPGCGQAVLVPANERIRSQRGG